MVDASETDVQTDALEVLPTPAYRMRKGAAYFRIGFGLFLALSGLLAIASCGPRASSMKWQDAGKVLGQESLFDLVLANVSDQTPVEQLEGALSQIEVASLGRDSEQDLWLVSFNLDQVCGRLGCLYTIVSRDADKNVKAQIWSQYLQPDIPTGSALAIVPPPNGDVEPGKFSCLEITQVANSALVHRTQCFENGGYRIVEEKQSLLL